MQNPVLLLSGEHGAVDMLAHLVRCPQYERARNIRRAFELSEFDNRELNVVLASDRNALSREVASTRARNPDRNGQLRPGIYPARSDLDRARALTVLPNRLCRHVGNSQADGSWAAF